MRREIIAGNWKMNHTPSEAVEFLKQLHFRPKEKQRVILCPSFVCLPGMMEHLPVGVELSAQNLHQKESGAYTGEVSAAMLKDLGVTMSLIGHSERRMYFGEGDELIARKISQALKHGLEVILCIGEQLDEREEGRQEDVVRSQLLGALGALSVDEMKHVHLAYEPVWAIGTGKTASSEDAQAMNAFIRGEVQALFDRTTAENTSILYGGSVKPENIRELMAMEDIDGALVGGASLKPASFMALLEY